MKNESMYKECGEQDGGLLIASRRSLNGVRCGRSSWVDRAGVGGDWKDGCRVESGGEDD